MDVCKVPTLQHLSCSKIVTSFFNKTLGVINVSFVAPDLRKNAYDAQRALRDEEYKMIKGQVLKDISYFNQCSLLQKKLESFIEPLFSEIDEWLNTCYRIWALKDDTLLAIVKTIPQCWLTDGTINREKSVELVVKNNNLYILNRFVFACFYCVYEEIFNIFRMLSPADKEYLRDTPYLETELNCLVGQWLEWLEGWLNKDWQYCVAWLLGTSFWDINVSVMKRVLSALAPIERHTYLFKALRNREVSNDVMRYCLSIMTRREEILICSDAAVKVFKCMASWPLRRNFSHMGDMMWPYGTVEIFCDILVMLLQQIRNQKWDYLETVVILKNLWRACPPHVLGSVRKNLYSGYVCPLKFVLEYDCSQVFSKQEFVDSFDPPKSLSVCH